MATQKGKRLSLYCSEREKQMLEYICNRTEENQSQVINALIMQEYYRLKDIPFGDRIGLKDKPTYSPDPFDSSQTTKGSST